MPPTLPQTRHGWVLIHARYFKLRVGFILTTPSENVLEQLAVLIPAFDGVPGGSTRQWRVPHSLSSLDLFCVLEEFSRTFPYFVSPVSYARFAVALIGTHRAGAVKRLGDTHREAERAEVPKRIGNRGKFCWLKLNSHDGESRETLLFNLPDAGYDLVDLLDRAIRDRELDTANAVGAATISVRPAVVFSGPRHRAVIFHLAAEFDLNAAQ